jgi:hypothetical protein
VNGMVSAAAYEEQRKSRASFFARFPQAEPPGSLYPKTPSAYFGLTPRKHWLGDIGRTDHISKVGDEMALTALYEEANVTMSRVA